MKKRVFYTEMSYALGLIIMAFAAAFTEKADFGMSMVVAPAYILHLNDQKASFLIMPKCLTVFSRCQAFPFFVLRLTNK